MVVQRHALAIDSVCEQIWSLCQSCDCVLSGWPLTRENTERKTPEDRDTEKSGVD